MPNDAFPTQRSEPLGAGAAIEGQYASPDSLSKKNAFFICLAVKARDSPQWTKACRRPRKAIRPWNKSTLANLDTRPTAVYFLHSHCCPSSPQGYPGTLCDPEHSLSGSLPAIPKHRLGLGLRRQLSKVHRVRTLQAQAQTRACSVITEYHPQCHWKNARV